MYTCIPAYMDICAPVNLYTYLHTYCTKQNTYKPAYLQTCIPTYIPTYLHTYIPTYSKHILPYMHAHPPALTRTHT